MTSILFETRIRKRAKLIKLILNIAIELKNLNNIHGVYEVYSALNNVAIHRLKRTTALIPDYDQKMQILEEIDEFFSKFPMEFKPKRTRSPERDSRKKKK